jgi:hypothetical protein
LAFFLTLHADALAQPPKYAANVPDSIQIPDVVKTERLGVSTAHSNRGSTEPGNQVTSN